MITLNTPVRDLKGVGPFKFSALIRLGISTVDQLLHHFPSKYYFAPSYTDGPLTEGQPATVSGIVTRLTQWGRNFEVRLDTGVDAVWFGGSYLRQSIFRGSRLMLSGVVRNGGFTNPEWRMLGPDLVNPDPAMLNTVTYPVTSGITSKDIRWLVGQCLDALTVGPGDVLRRVHQPLTQATVDAARQALKYDELFYMQLALAVRQAERESEPTNIQCNRPPGHVHTYFPFEFTVSQAVATGEVIADLMRSHPMNRLLQGDVGCGKTAVAAYAAIVMAFNGGQTAILCPTEILARQHYETIRGYFERAGVKCGLLTGLTPLQCSKGGSTIVEGMDIVIGTTALISERVSYANLGLVIIDEQHKFGVEQRAALRRHGNPHVLVMTATPIPRTMAMTVFGDLGVSVIRDMPPGRKPVKTSWAKDGPLAVAAREITWAELAAGHQVYVVCPRIEALDDEMRAVEEVQQEYAKLFYPHIVWPLHGKCTPEYKQTVAEQWMSGGVGVLVSTTVVEVGVDNPNATVMVIEGAERFGLAQLHQLRGRVGRGNYQGYCFLLSDTDSPEARTRLRTMEKTNDGFIIAEEDLKIRGPGDLLSTEQHGLPSLKIADLCDDFDLLCEARKAARELVANRQVTAKMRQELERRFGATMHLGDTA